MDSEESTSEEISFDDIYCELDPGEFILNKYVIVNKLGQGTFCTVYSCKDVDSKFHAVKIYNPGDDNIRYYDKEYISIKKITDSTEGLINRYAITLRDYGVIISYDDAYKRSFLYPCIITELCSGSLGDVLESYKKSDVKTELPSNISIEMANNLIRQIFECLAYIHGKNITNNDIRPENFLVRNVDNSLQVILGDFNSATETGTQLDYCAGTLQYRAPEIMFGASFGPGCDIWSAGCCVFEIITGKVLFDVSLPDVAETAIENCIDHNNLEIKNFFRRKIRITIPECGDKIGTECFCHEYENSIVLYGIRLLLGKPPYEYLNNKNYYNDNNRLKFFDHNKNHISIGELLAEHNLPADYLEYIKNILNDILRYRVKNRLNAVQILEKYFI